MDFFPEIEIPAAQAEALARGLWAVARADGQVHEREAVLVAQLYQETIHGSPASLAALEREPAITPDALAGALGPGTDVAHLFVKTAVLLALVDNTYSAPERELVGRYATALAVMPATLARIEEEVREFLLGQLTHLANTQGVLEVSKGLPR